MSGVAGRVAVARIAAGQWGLLTTAQATAAGVSRMMLSRMAEWGELERVMHGVYATPAAVGMSYWRSAPYGCRWNPADSRTSAWPTPRRLGSSRTPQQQHFTTQGTYSIDRSR
ncbi:hypothetical protein GCM10009718_36850 [Isoptericola halotolerans]|uniref:type IV toxin-antitoxin system AbiEi family antitoxin domain-containing protein n=1 Tax=Isoptericola halotolerans TaxID=300560 RepID=UPI00149421C1